MPNYFYGEPYVFAYDKEQKKKNHYKKKSLEEKERNREIAVIKCQKTKRRKSTMQVPADAQIAVITKDEDILLDFYESVNLETKKTILSVVQAMAGMKDCLPTKKQMAKDGFSHNIVTFVRLALDEGIEKCDEKENGNEDEQDGEIND